MKKLYLCIIFGIFLTLFIAGNTFAAPADCPPGKICNPLNVDTFEELLDAIIGFIFWVGITLAPVMLIIGGFLYITSGGDPNKVTTAKRWIIWTLIGVAIIILAGGLVAVIKSILGVED